MPIPIVLAFALAALPVQDRALIPGKAADVGMSAARLEEAARILRHETRTGRVTAASIIVARRGVIVLHRGTGKLRPDKSGAAAGPDTVYILASITKPVTAAALMLLVERGDVSLSDPVRKYLPEFKGPDREKVRVQDLLSHTSGLPDMLPENIELRKANAPLKEFVKGAMTTPLLFEPQTSFTYQSMGILLAAEIVERVTNMPLPKFEEEEFFRPLGMTKSSLGIGTRRLEETAMCQGAPSFESNAKDKKRYGANTLYWRKIGHPWGGMHSSAYDVGIFLQLFLNGGIYNGRRIFGLPTVDLMTTDRNGGKAAPWGLGWGLKRSKTWNFFGDLASDRSFGHSGASGTVAWADPSRDLVCVILTTRALREDRGFLLRSVSNVVQSAVVE